MVGPDLIVTVREDEQHPAQREPPAQKRDQVKRRLVGPVQILHDHHGPAQLPRPVERIKQGVKDGAPLTIGNPLTQRPADLPSNVMQRTKGARGKQRIAGAPKNLSLRPGNRGKRGSKTGLPGAGLPGDNSDPPATDSIGQQGIQTGQRLGALQELHPG